MPSLRQALIRYQKPAANQFPFFGCGYKERLHCIIFYDLVIQSWIDAFSCSYPTIFACPAQSM